MTVSAMAPATPEVDHEPRVESRCKVCMSSMADLPNGPAVKDLVTELLMVPRPYESIMRTVEPFMSERPFEARFSCHSVRRHAQRHLRWEEQALRAIADRRANHLAQVDAATERMLDATVVLEAIRQRGLDLLLQDEIRPSVKDLLAASAALEALEEEADGTFSPALLLAQLDTVIQVIREEIPEARWDQVLARIEGKSSSAPEAPASDPVFDELLAEMDTVDG
jgi:hypothetical protein